MATIETVQVFVPSVVVTRPALPRLSATRSLASVRVLRTPVLMTFPGLASVVMRVLTSMSSYSNVTVSYTAFVLLLLLDQ